MLADLVSYHIVPGVESTRAMIERSKSRGDGYAILSVGGDAIVARHEPSRTGLHLRDESGSRTPIAAADIAQGRRHDARPRPGDDPAPAMKLLFGNVHVLFGAMACKMLLMSAISRHHGGRP